jgi:uncharacterized protein YbjT (DUF2867 family)
MKIVVAGASGFVGKQLINVLKNNHKVIAISRRSKVSEDNIEWKQCDLFSLLDIEKTLEGADVAVYLVHSMLPSARLTQGSFRDFDMILADNFSRACKSSGVKHIVYLSGIIPPDAILSEHLQSRLEVENILKSSGVPTSSLRAGLIIGPGGSSFEMMLRLVQRLPFMICPSWTATLSYPISVWDVVEIIKNRIEKTEITDHECFDLCGPAPLSYKEMMRLLSEKIGRKHYFLPVPFVSPKLSKLWVSLITGAPKNLVYPLVDSLKTHMIPLSPRPQELNFIKPMSFDESITLSIAQTKAGKNPNAYSYSGIDNDSCVRSVQRVTTLFRSDVKVISQVYFSWLHQFLKPIFSIEQQDRFYNIRLIFLKKPLLIFEASRSRSYPDRELFYIRGGLLVRESPRARLEFRNIYQGLYKIIAIHDYRPRLPWYIYKYTQALLHLVVMRAFGNYLVEKKL